MQITLKIINELRLQTAALKGRLIALSGNMLLSEPQNKAAETAIDGLNFIVCQYICLIRKAYGEKNCWKLEEIDKPIGPKEVSVSPRVQLKEIIESARDINIKMITLPGQDGCNDEQSQAIEKLVSGFAEWRMEHLKQLEISFANKS